MVREEFKFSFEVFNSITELNTENTLLLKEAIKATEHAYAPYSRFRVAAVARLATGETVRGTNQENASYPAGICAERVLLSAISSSYPGIAIDTIAISYHNETSDSSHPISPCGICRQSLQEYEHRQNAPIRLILGGKKGKVYIIPQSSLLMPLAFTGDELK
ncbi:MAG: cytidine deaminase [Bacteroidetes bacterium]|nr:cytidine deaminase [Bacteroidota bacterium]MBS1975351.1 cytidine deaminase [Bacteroidota bacterium]